MSGKPIFHVEASDRATTKPVSDNARKRGGNYPLVALPDWFHWEQLPPLSVAWPTEVLMATPATIYFAGIATVVAAIGTGFGGAILFTKATSPTIQKQQPAAFAKRDQPVVGSPVSAPVAEPALVGGNASKSSLIPEVPDSAEKVVALDYAPPQLQSSPAASLAAPAPAAIAPAPAEAKPTPELASPKPLIATETTGPAKAPQTKRQALEKKKTPTEVVKPEKKKTIVVERKRRSTPPAEADDEPRMSFASERTELPSKDFFSFLFGN